MKYLLTVLLLVAFVAPTAAEELTGESQSSSSETSETTDTVFEVVESHRPSDPMLGDLFHIASTEFNGGASRELVAKLGNLRWSEVQQMHLSVEKVSATYTLVLTGANVSDQDREAATRSLEVVLQPLLDGICRLNFNIPDGAENPSLGAWLAALRGIQVHALRLHITLIDRAMAAQHAALTRARALLPAQAAGKASKPR